MSRGLTPIIVDEPQRSEGWFKARRGHLTSSDVKFIFLYSVRSLTKAKMAEADAYYESAEFHHSAEVLSKLREEYPMEYALQAGIELVESEKRINLRRRIVAERIYRVSVEEDKYKTQAMLWGTVAEAPARMEYVKQTRNIAEESKMALHPTLMTGSSRDSTIVDRETGEIGNGETKCLTPARHIYDLILPDEVPDEFTEQIQHQMWIYDTDWCDFTGWDGRLPLDAKPILTLIKRVPRDEFYIDYVLEPAVIRFLDECDRDERRFWAIIRERQKAIA